MMIYIESRRRHHDFLFHLTVVVVVGFFFVTPVYQNYSISFDSAICDLQCCLIFQNGCVKWSKGLQNEMELENSFGFAYEWKEIIYGIY